MLGLAGLVGLFELGAGDVVLYLFTGAVFSYVGFAKLSSEATRSLVGGIGILYLLCGMLVIAVSFAFDLPVEGGDVMWVVLGILNVLGAMFLRWEGDSSAGS